MKIVYKAGDITEAHIVSGLLNANNIETHVDGYYLQGGIGDLAAMDFISVQVEDENVAHAKSIISDYEVVTGEPGENEKELSSELLPRVFASIVAFLFFIIIFILISEIG